jgi:hypothetical protein
MVRRKKEQLSLAGLDFWDKWPNITAIEKRAITATTKARSKVISSTPSGELVAIYIKGSFIRREMNDQSDVDMVPIVKHTAAEGKVFSVNDDDIYPVMVVPLSIEELKRNELMTKSGQSIDLRAKPDRFLRMINECRLIFGEPLAPSDYPIRSDLQSYRDEVEIIKNGYIPLFLDGQIDFSPLLKEFFWMTEMELAVQGIKTPHTFTGIATGAPKDHLIHEALRLRQNDHLNKATEKTFVNKLLEYISTNIHS